MGKAIFHAENSAKKFGGKTEDYLDIHELMDSSGEVFPDVRHRALTHHRWFIGKILVRIFGETRKNSAGKRYSVREVAEQHILEDYGALFIPSVQDFFAEMRLLPWMNNAQNGAIPPSRRRVIEDDEQFSPGLHNLENGGVIDTAGNCEHPAPIPRRTSQRRRTGRPRGVID